MLTDDDCDKNHIIEQQKNQLVFLCICIANSFSVQFKYLACQFICEIRSPMLRIFLSIRCVFVWVSFRSPISEWYDIRNEYGKHRFTFVVFVKQKCWTVGLFGALLFSYISKDTANEKVAKSCKTKSAIIFNSHIYESLQIVCCMIMKDG